MSGRSVGDFNNDLSVNVADLNILLNGWGSEYVISDLNALLANWDPEPDPEPEPAPQPEPEPEQETDT